MRVLIVEDEEELAQLLARSLLAIGLPADVAGSCLDASDLLAVAAYDLVVLDRRLPDGDGLALIPLLRGRRPDLPVLALTALDDVGSRIAGLNAGADDYLAKPFDTGELLARVRALLRRPGLAPEAPIAVGRLLFDARSRAARVGSEPLVLAARELNLLEALVQRANRVVTREALVEAVYEMGADVLPNALDANVSRLRARLRDLGAGVEVTAVRGVGYMLTAGG